MVRHYEVPINSLIYVWALSISMATVATIVYANLQRDERAAFVKQPSFRIVALTGLAVAFFVLRGLIAPPEQSALPLASAALLLAVKHSWLMIRNPGARPRWIVPGWCAAAIAIAYFGAPSAFLAFPISIFILSVIPSLAQFFADRKQARNESPSATDI